MTAAELTLTLAAAAVLSALAVAASIRIAVRLAAVDAPDGERKQQAVAVPRLGGLAVAVTFAMVALAEVAITSGSTLAAGVAGILVPAMILAAVGAWDDARGLGPWIRLGMQVLVALLAYGFGTRVAMTGNGVIDATLTVVFIVAVVNGVNLLDNSDGLATVTVLVSSAGATLIALLLGQELVAALGCALVGVCVGFLWHNWFPARVYLGDAGAYLLGFLLAVLVIRLRPEQLSPAVGAAIALMLVALPLADTTFVVVRRLRAGVHPFTAGRDHLSHALQERGRSVPASVLTLQVLPAIGVVGALALAVVSL